MKKTLLSTALVTIFTVGAMSVAHAELTGNTTAEFTAQINITSTNTCTLDVTPPADTLFTAAWNYDGEASPATSTLTPTGQTEPAMIRVVANGGADCTVNNIKVLAEPSAGQERYDVAAFNNFGSSGGFWGYAPLLAQAKFYTDNNFASAATGTITATSGAGYLLTFSNTAERQSGYTATNLGGVMNLTTVYNGRDNVRGSMYSTSGADSIPIAFNSSAPTEKYLSAQIGVGVLVTTAPRAVGAWTTAEPLLAANNDVATMPFTVTVSEQ